MESSLVIYFYIKNRENRFGKLPIMVRVTMNEKTDVFSPKIYITLGTWNKKYQCVEGKNPEAKEVNSKLKEVPVICNIGKTLPTH